MERKRKGRFLRAAAHHLGVVTGSLLLTAAFFLVLPLMQAIQAAPSADLIVQTVDTANIPPPPPPPEEEPEEEEEPEPEEPPPELSEEAPPLELAQLELALNPGFGSGALTGDFEVKLDNVVGRGASAEELFSIADLDQKPRVVYQPAPVLDASARKKAPGRVVIVFVVDQQGAVQSPVVQSSTDPVLERPALASVKQWKFEPGRRSGQPVRFRMRAPITFPESLAR